MIRKFFYWMAVSLFALIISGCAEKKEAVGKFIVPSPPETPRLFHVATYHGEVDFEKQNGLDMFIGEGGAFTKNMVKPYGVSAYNGKIYATDTAQGVVFVFDPVLKKVTYLGDQQSGKLALPVGVAFDGKGLIYVSDAKIKKIFVYDENGSAKSVIGSPDELYRPTGIAINRELGLLYVADTLQHHIKVYTLDGKLVSTIGKRGEGDGEFNYPTNVNIDRRNGNIVVGDTQNFRIQIFDKNGKFISKFGKIGDKPGMFARPKGVAVDTEGHIYAADGAFNNIQIFNDKGELLLYFGGPGTDPGTFQLPTALYCDEDDRLYATEGFTARVQVFQYISDAWKKNHPAEYQKLLETK